MQKRYCVFALISVLLLGCVGSDEQLTPKLQHALLTKPQSQLVAEGLARLMRSNNIAVAHDVFTHSSVMVVDNVTKTDKLGNPIMGKQLNMPDSFELLIKGSDCFVRHLDSKATEPLPEVQCKPNN